MTRLIVGPDGRVEEVERDTVPAPPVKNYNPIGALRVALQQMTKCHWELYDAVKEIEDILDRRVGPLETFAEQDEQALREIRDVVDKALYEYQERES